MLELTGVRNVLYGLECVAWRGRSPRSRFRASPLLVKQLIPLPSEEGRTLNVFRTFASMPRPEYGLDCLICATFARQRGEESTMIDSGRGTARAEDAQGTPTQIHISPSILVYEDKAPDAEGVDCGIKSRM